MVNRMGLLFLWCEMIAGYQEDTDYYDNGIITEYTIAFNGVSGTVCDEEFINDLYPYVFPATYPFRPVIGCYIHPTMIETMSVRYPVGFG